MRLTVLGSCGAWPEAGQACSGYLVEHDEFRLLVDLGYAIVPRLLERVTAGQVDAVLISHGHPDHCADLNPLLRARALRADPSPSLPVYALPGALDAVLALDRPGMLAGAYVLHEFTAGSRLEIGPFRVQTRLLPHRAPPTSCLASSRGRADPVTPGPAHDHDAFAPGRPRMVWHEQPTGARQKPQSPETATTGHPTANSGLLAYDEGSGECPSSRASTLLGRSASVAASRSILNVFGYSRASLSMATSVACRSST
jgi:hypothetical protein